MHRFNLTFYNANNQSSSNITGKGHIECEIFSPEAVRTAVCTQYPGNLSSIGDSVVAVDVETSDTVTLMVTGGGITCC